MGKYKVLDLLEAADWKDIIFRLTHYAYWKASKYTWKCGNPKQLLGGKTPEDIALGAIEKVWSGVRDWNPDKYPDLIKHLMRIVDSDLNHLINSLESKKTPRLTDKFQESGKNIDYEEKHLNRSSIKYDSYDIVNPEKQLIAKEDEEFEEKVIKEFYEIVKGDEDLEMLLICFEEGINKPEEIATQTGWDIQKVYNLKRKISRKAVKLSKVIRSR